MMNRHNRRQFQFDISETTEPPIEHQHHMAQQSEHAHDRFEQRNDLIPLGSISLDAVIQTLVAKNILSHSELSEQESRFRNGQARLGKAQRTFSPAIQKEHIVRTHSNREHEPVDYKFFRKIFSKFKWSRTLGSLLFGWKWRRKGGA